MDALDKLIQYADDAIGYGDYALHAPKVKILAEQIKNEINNSYIKLPTDIDEMSIYVHDTITHPSCKTPIKVCVISYDGYKWWAEDSYGNEYMVNECHYVESRTIENTLLEFIDAYHDAENDPNIYSIQKRTVALKETIDKYATELREIIEAENA